MDSITRFLSKKDGSVAIIGAFTLPVIAGFFGIGLEVGMWQSARSDLQAAVDATARASAIELEATKDKSKARSVAYAAAIVNDLDLSSLNISFEQHGDNEAVAVKASRIMPRFFSSLYSNSDTQVVTAAAAAYSATAKIGACILALKENGMGIALAGTSDIIATGCSVHSNAKRVDSFGAGGSAHVVAECLTTVQTSQVNAKNYTLNTCDDIEDMADPIVDPYASVPIPTTGNGDSAIVGPYIDMSTQTYKTSANGDVIGSGVYKHVLINSDTVIDDGATIVIDSGTLEFKGNNSATGKNVTFIFIDSKLKTGSQFDLKLHAKSSGTYAGLIFAGDRNAHMEYQTITGGAATELVGAIYFPGDSLSMVGGSQATSGCFHVIAAELSLAGHAAFGNVCGGAGTKTIGEDSAGGIKFVKPTGGPV